jgi:hypothetical protein
MEGGDVGPGRVVGDELAIDAALADAAGDELAVLAAEVEDDDGVDPGRRCGRPILAEQVGGLGDGRFDGPDDALGRVDDAGDRCRAAWVVGAGAHRRCPSSHPSLSLRRASPGVDSPSIVPRNARRNQPAAGRAELGGGVRVGPHDAASTPASEPPM